MDPKVPHAEGILGFPIVLQQISKIMSHVASSKGSATAKTGKSKSVEIHSPQIVMRYAYPDRADECFPLTGPLFACRRSWGGACGGQPLWLLYSGGAAVLPPDA